MRPPVDRDDRRHPNLRVVRGEPFKDLSLLAQNPLGGLECTHTILSEDGLNQAKRVSVLLHQRALEDQVTVFNLSVAVPADVDPLVSCVVQHSPGEVRAAVLRVGGTGGVEMHFGDLAGIIKDPRLIGACFGYDTCEAKTSTEQESRRVSLRCKSLYTN